MVAAAWAAAMAKRGGVAVIDEIRRRRPLRFIWRRRVRRGSLELNTPAAKKAVEDRSGPRTSAESAEVDRGVELKSVSEPPRSMPARHRTPPERKACRANRI